MKFWFWCAKLLSHPVCINPCISEALMKDILKSIGSKIVVILPLCAICISHCLLLTMYKYSFWIIYRTQTQSCVADVLSTCFVSLLQIILSLHMIHNIDMLCQWPPMCFNIHVIIGLIHADKKSIHHQLTALACAKIRFARFNTLAPDMFRLFFIESYLIRPRKMPFVANDSLYIQLPRHFLYSPDPFHLIMISLVFIANMNHLSRPHYYA